MSMLDQLNREWNIIKEKDEAAKAKGTLIGRFISIPYADSAAYYEVVEVDGVAATVEHIPYCDAWHHPMVEDCDCILPIKMVESNINRRDAMDEMFGGK